MRWGALKRALRALPGEDFDLMHIHTPFVAHYAGVWYAKRIGVPCIATYHTFFEEYLHHYLPILPRRIGRFIARHFTRSQCRDVRGLIAPSEPMREVLKAYGVADAHPCAADRSAGGSLPGRPAGALPRARWACRRIGRSSPTWGAWRTRRTSSSSWTCSPGCAQQLPKAMLHHRGRRPGAGVAASARRKEGPAPTTCAS